MSEIIPCCAVPNCQLNPCENFRNKYTYIGVCCTILYARTISMQSALLACVRSHVSAQSINAYCTWPPSDALRCAEYWRRYGADKVLISGAHWCIGRVYLGEQRAGCSGCATRRRRCRRRRRTYCQLLKWPCTRNSRVSRFHGLLAGSLYQRVC